MKDFIAQARKRGVVVELTLFSAHYEEWPHSPLNPANNVNGMGPVNCEQVHHLADSRITQVQEALTVKLVTELNEFDNLYYELINEPYMKCGATDAWQAHVARLIARTEAALPRRHLVAQNIANGAARVERLPEGISILNFHYASPPDAVAANAPLRVPVAFDESGFRGPEDAVYRRQAWEFVMAGGAVFNNLDWSFTVASPTGHNREWDKGLGGGGPALRRALGALGRFIHGFDFVRMAPDQDVIQGGLPPGAVAFDCVAETLRRTALGDLAPGDAVNLERAMRLGDRLGGHLVQGHVDGTGTVRSAREEGESLLLEVAAPPGVLRYVVEKGSITVDGVSLTVAGRGPDAFSVALIPHTMAVTTLGPDAVGRRVNLEADVVAKYVEALAGPHLAARGEA